MVQELLKLGKDRLGARTYDPASIIGVAFRGMLALGWRTGHRLAEFVAHPSGEICYVTRHDVTYIIAGVPVCDPTTAQLAALRPGDTILVAPPLPICVRHPLLLRTKQRGLHHSADRACAPCSWLQPGAPRGAHAAVRRRIRLAVHAQRDGHPATLSPRTPVWGASGILPLLALAAQRPGHRPKGRRLLRRSHTDDLQVGQPRIAQGVRLPLHDTSLHINWVDRAEHCDEGAEEPVQLALYHLGWRQDELPLTEKCE